MATSRSSRDDIATVPRVGLQPASTNVLYRLDVIEGPDQGASATLDVLTPIRLLVGKSQSCGLCLSDVHISRRHAAFEVDGKRLRVSDLSSTNGTFVDGIPIVEVFVQGGEVVRLGSTALQVTRVERDRPQLLSNAQGFGRLVGASEAMRRLYPLCDRLAKSDVPVLIEGETGTGKEVLAEALHEQGARAGGPFVVFDCTVIPASLMEAELFGHEKGAFTGATGARKGLFEQAHGGTILLDELGELPAELQPKLLRVFERRELRPIGSSSWRRVDVRILVATRRNLDQEVQEGRFRDDLFHRLCVARIELPPLRRRKGDVALLARHFWHEMNGPPEALDDDLLSRWERDPWPGNVRALRNAVSRRLALGDLASFGEVAEAEVASTPDARTADQLLALLERDLPYPQARDAALALFERLYVRRALSLHGGSVVAAARASGIARRYFQMLRARSEPSER